MLNILAELGGIFNSFYLIGFAFTISFSYNLLMSSIIRKLYLFKAKFESEKKKPKKDDKGDGGSKKPETLERKLSKIDQTRSN